MNIVATAVNTVTRTTEAAAAVAGAASGAVIEGVAGAVGGSAAGVRSGIRHGSQSPPAAALTFGVLGAVGVVEWPVLLGIGATAMVLRQLRPTQARSASDPVSPAMSPSDGAVSPITTSAPVKRTAAKTAKAPVRTTSTRTTAARARRSPAKGRHEVS